MNKKGRKGVTLDELGEMLGFVVERMATKDDIARLERDIVRIDRNLAGLSKQFIGLSEQFSGMEREMRTFRVELGDLSGKADNVIGYRKEIDHVLERTALIEKHLGLD